MQKRGNIVSYTAEELAAMRRRGEGRTDWAKVDATTPEEVERQAAEDGDIRPEGWEETAIMGLPPRKEAVNLRIDADVLEWFRRTGRGYQTRINNVLRAFVESRRHMARS
jgi:uncharacterized protein (DUF4415 family)